MKPKGPLPHLQVPAICPCPSPDQARPCPPFPLPEDPFNIIFPSTPGSSKRSPSLRFPHQNPVYSSSLPHACYKPRSSHSSRVDRQKAIGEKFRSLSYQWLLPETDSTPKKCAVALLKPRNISRWIVYTTTFKDFPYLRTVIFFLQALYCTQKR